MHLLQIVSELVLHAVVWNVEPFTHAEHLYGDIVPVVLQNDPVSHVSCDFMYALGQ